VIVHAEGLSAGAAGFVSPHLDDVVLSCAAAITPESVVVTVFSSGPKSVNPLPAWDVSCGFAPGDDVSAVRKREDDAALAQFGASGEHLDFWSYQYRSAPPGRFPRANHLLSRLARRSEDEPDPQLVDEVASQLGSVFDGVQLSTWYVPLGVGHPDHKIVSTAVLRLARTRPDRQWILYEDLPYARQGTDLLDRALKRVTKAGCRLDQSPLLPPVDTAPKRVAVECYQSQLKALGSLVDLSIAATETYHVLLGSS
jgi:LmbE family N-acetylglucosaminyl deacetylase